MGKHAVSGAAGQTAGNGRPSDPGCHGIQIQCMGRAGSYYRRFLENGYHEPLPVETRISPTIRPVRRHRRQSLDGQHPSPISFKYSESTGALLEQSDTVEGKAQSLKYGYNTLGQLTSYTEADGTTSTYEYEKEGLYRLTMANDGKGTQAYCSSETTGEPATLKDTVATGLPILDTYDGRVTCSRSYPNGMTASVSYNQVGAPINLEYRKEDALHRKMCVV